MKQVARDVYHLPVMPMNSINCYVAEGFLIDAGIRSSAGKIINSIADKEVYASPPYSPTRFICCLLRNLGVISCRGTASIRRLIIPRQKVTKTVTFLFIFEFQKS
ncbi:hypothetical protein [Telluribacter sp. SYSU D00476]|uniref:hypothetical protein n=1 Tax=Telluribacter sp. SYSU D00476 TaxID=2811430 RepID=UPI001FF2FECD|nr:hypothetical protein [Telluribacter sp. SYSU D00476]